MPSTGEVSYHTFTLHKRKGFKEQILQQKRKEEKGLVGNTAQRCWLEEWVLVSFHMRKPEVFRLHSPLVLLMDFLPLFCTSGPLPLPSPALVQGMARGEEEDPRLALHFNHLATKSGHCQVILIILASVGHLPPVGPDVLRKEPGSRAIASTG